jgi:putative serine protease PepD
MDVKVSQERRDEATRVAAGTGEAATGAARARVSPALRTLVLVVVAALSGALAGALVARHRSSTPRDPGPSTASDVARMLASIGPAVVSINTRPVQSKQLFESSAPPGSGTGIVIRSDGMILTDAAIVASDRPISVRLADGRAFAARVVGSDVGAGIAVLKIATGSLRVAPLVSDDDLDVGDDVVALGDALALPSGPTVSRGVVAALHRTITMSTADVALGLPARLSELIQVTEPLGAGTAGGPVIDTRGRVVGLATLTASGDRAPGFAIEISRVRDAITALEHGRAPADRLGVEAIDVTPQLARAYRLPVQSGAFVASVIAGSPAATAGLQPGDIVVRVDRERVATAEDLAREAREPSNATLPLTLVRAGRTMTITVPLG